MLAAWACFHAVDARRLGLEVRLGARPACGRDLDGGREPSPHGADAEAQERHLAPRVGPLLVPEPLDRPRAGDARRRDGRVLELEPVAGRLRRRTALPDPPVAVRPAAPGGGACRPEDGPLQRTPLHVRAQRGADPSGALRAAAFSRHGRPRPPARHQQHVRPPRRRRGPAGDRRGLPRPASPLRRPGPLRRGGVRDPASGDAARPGARDRGANPARRGRAHLRRRDLERADPRNRLDRRRRLPARRRRRQRAHPRGRPRRLPRQAPGTQPRPRRELGAAPRPGAAPDAPRSRPGGGRARHSASARGRGACPSTNAATRARMPSRGRASSPSRRASRPSSASSASSASARACSAGSSGRAPTGSASPQSSRWSASARRSRSRSTTARSPSAPSARSPERRSSVHVPRYRSRSRSPWSSGAPAARRFTPCSSTSGRSHCRLSPRRPSSWPPASAGGMSAEPRGT